jgi:hypothetical protein
VLVATVAGIGFVPSRPGTFGSIPGVALALGLRQVAPWWAEGAALVVLFVAACGPPTPPRRTSGASIPARS